MKLIFALLLLPFLAAPVAAQSAYDSITLSTTTGRERRAVSGYVAVAASSKTPGNYTILLDGPNGGVNASSVTLRYGLKAASATVSGLVAAGSFSGNGALITGISGTGILAGSVDTAALATDAVTAAKILNGAVTLTKLAASSVDSSKLATGAIDTNRLGADAVGTASILNGAVTLTKLAASSVDSSKLVTGAVDTNRLGVDAVGTASILNGAVTLSKLASSSVDTGKLTTDSVTGAKVLAGAIDTTKLASDSVTGAKVLAGAIDTTKLASDSVTTVKLITGAVDTNKMAADAVTTPKIFSGAVTNDKLGAASIDSSKIQTGAVDTGRLGADAVAAANILNGAVTLVKMGANSVDTGKLVTDSVTAAKILDGAVTLTKMASSSVGNGNIVNGAVDTGKLATDSVSTVKLLNAAVTDAKISAVAGSKVTGSVASATLATSATNLAAGAGNYIPYQTGVGATAFLASAGADNSVMQQSLAGGPFWTSNPTFGGVCTATTFSGSGASLTNLPGGQITAGTVDTTRLATDAVASSQILNGSVTSVKLATAYLPLTGGTMVDGGNVYNVRLGSPTVTGAGGAGGENFSKAALINGMPADVASQGFYANANPRILDQIDGVAVAWAKGSQGLLSKDTADFQVSSQSYKLSTSGSGLQTLMKWTSISPLVDVSTMQIVFLAKIDGFANMQTGNMQWSTDNQTSNFFTCDWTGARLNGSGQTYKYPQEGEWHAYTINRAKCTKTGTPDWGLINSIAFTMKDNGTNGSTVTLHVQMLGLFPEPPRAIMSIGFDNGYASIYSTGAAVMAKYGLRASNYITVENLTGAAATWMDITSTTKLGTIYNWEMGTHPGGRDLTTVSTSDVQNLIVGDMGRIAQASLASNMRGCVYPLGGFNPGIEAVFREHCNYARTIVNGDVSNLDFETYPAADRWRLKAYSVLNTDTFATLKPMVDACVNYHAHCNFLFHAVKNPADGLTDVLPSTFETFMSYISTQNATILPLGEAMQLPYHEVYQSSMTVTRSFIAGVSTTGVQAMAVTPAGATFGATSSYSVTTSSGINVQAGMVVAAGGFNGPLYGSGANITAATIDTAKLATDAVTAAAIKNLTITLIKLAQDGAATNNILQWNGSKWGPAAPSAAVSGSTPTTRTVLTSGSGQYTTPSNVIQLRIRMCGAGGGGGASNNGSDGSAGSNTYFGAVSTAAAGGGGKGTTPWSGGVGGNNGGGTQTFSVAASSGGWGSGSIIDTAGVGGAGPFGGTALEQTNVSGNGGSASPNSCSGGGGGFSTTTTSGGGGGAGEYKELLINNPAATYQYSVGAGGAGASGTQNGGNGGSGILIIDEFY